MSTQQWVALLGQALADTLYMTVPATILSYLIGMPLGVLLVVTQKDHIAPAPRLNALVGMITNFLRSVPFIILLAMLFPVTRKVMGTAIGTHSMIFPLVVSAFPYVARMVEGALKEVDRGVIEAAQSMGSTKWQIMTRVMIPEALPSLVNGAAIALVTILSYTALASAAGGGGLGAVAITKGLNQRKFDILYAASAGLIILVQIFSVIGTKLSQKLDHRLK